MKNLIKIGGPLLALGCNLVAAELANATTFKFSYEHMPGEYFYGKFEAEQDENAPHRYEITEITEIKEIWFNIYDSNDLFFTSLKDGNGKCVSFDGSGNGGFQIGCEIEKESKKKLTKKSWVEVMKPNLRSFSESDIFIQTINASAKVDTC